MELAGSLKSRITDDKRIVGLKRTTKILWMSTPNFFREHRCHHFFHSIIIKLNTTKWRPKKCLLHAIFLFRRKCERMISASSSATHQLPWFCRFSGFCLHRICKILHNFTHIFRSIFLQLKSSLLIVQLCLVRNIRNPQPFWITGICRETFLSWWGTIHCWWYACLLFSNVHAQSKKELEKKKLKLLTGYCEYTNELLSQTKRTNPLLCRS